MIENDAERDAVNAAIGARIKYLRKRAGLSQPKYARILGLSQSAISEIENGYEPGVSRPRDIHLDELARFAQPLGVTVVELVTGLGYTDEPVRIEGVTARASAEARPGKVS
jgi:transcriptional regulator with XRE-family HTH domain